MILTTIAAVKVTIYILNKSKLNPISNSFKSSAKLLISHIENADEKIYEANIINSESSINIELMRILEIPIDSNIPTSLLLDITL